MRFFWFRISLFLLLATALTAAAPAPDPALLAKATAEADNRQAAEWYRQASAQQLTLTPQLVQPGSPLLIRIDDASNAAPQGEWLGHKLQFFRAPDGQSWLALAGADVETPLGPSTLHIVLAGGKGRELSRAILIRPARYRTGRLTVAPSFIAPSPEDQKRIEAEIALKQKLFAASAPEPLWSGSFRVPVKSPPTDSFGTRRTFNGKLASIHKGMDFRAPTGTPVLAGNSGVVVLARPLFFEGNCVVLDHGQGLYTLSMHLSRIDVREGQTVAAGDRLGLSGATGRVTGPHLHWAVRWQDAYLDPAKVLLLPLPVR